MIGVDTNVLVALAVEEHASHSQAVTVFERELVAGGSPRRPARDVKNGVTNNQPITWVARSSQSIIGIDFEPRIARMTRMEEMPFNLIREIRVIRGYQADFCGSALVTLT